MVTSISLSRLRAEAQVDEEAQREIASVEESAREVSARFRRLEEADVRAFAGYLAARRLPRGSAEEKSSREQAIRRAAREATEVPLATLDAALETLALAGRRLRLATRSVLRAESDVGCAVDLAHAAARAAELNVRVNLPLLGDEGAASAERLAHSLSRLATEYPRLRGQVIERIAPSKPL
jgi:formiminotetrahydrofolate cyclodeaminase